MTPVHIPAYYHFDTAIQQAINHLKIRGEEITTETWQGIQIGKAHAMLELINVTLQVRQIPEEKEELAKQVEPDLPWAEDQFKERMSTIPLNPGETYRNWKFFRNTEEDIKFRTMGGKFSHTYMERFWPKWAGRPNFGHSYPANRGIWYAYGDLDDMINLLGREPRTRQAFIPIFFPEDTGAVQGQRVPCTLGYWLIMRKNELHITYHIRACDAFKHMRNDIYMAARLCQWVLQELRYRQSHESLIDWHNVKPGSFTMHIGSFHVFKAELNRI